MSRGAWKLVRRGLALAFLGFVFLLGIVAMLLNTESGSRFVINRVDALVPGSLYADEVDGTLWRGLRIRVLRYRDDNGELAISDLDVVINWPSALAGSASFDTLGATEVVFRDSARREPATGGLEVEMPPLPLRISIERSAIGTISIIRDEGDTTITDLSVAGAVLTEQRIRFDSFSAGYGDISIAVTDADSTLAGEVPVTATFAWSAGVDGAGSGGLTGSLETLQLRHTLDRPWTLETTGELRLLGRTEPAFDLVNRWERIDLDAATLSDGEVRVHGIIDDYETEFRATIEEPRIPALVVAGRASGDRLGFAETSIAVNAEPGAMTADGSLRWAPEPGAALAVRIEDFDPAFIDERLAGRLSATANVRVDGPDTWQVSDAELGGTLFGAEISASGLVGAERDSYRCRGCEVTLGGNTAAVDGELEGTRINADIEVDAPNLATLEAGVRGSLNVDGRVGGSLDLPYFHGLISGEALGYEDYRVESLRLESQDPGDGAFDLTLAASQVSRDETALGSLDAVARGMLDDAGVDLTWSLPEVVSVTATADLGIAEDQIGGTIRRAAIDGPHSGRWVLAAPARVDVAPDALSIGEHRWLLPSGQLAVSTVELVDQRISLVADLTGFSLATANPLLPDGYQLAGEANADIDVQRDDGGWRGRLEWSQANTVLTVTPDEEEPVDLAISDARLSAVLEGSEGEVEANLRLEPGITLRTSGRVTDLSGEPQVDGTVSLDGDYWKWVSTFVPELDNFDGDLAAELRVSGPVAEPRLAGTASWTDGSAIVPALNVAISDVNIRAEGDRDGTARVTGSLSSGGGRLAIDGSIEDLLLASRNIELNVSGDNAEIMNWPEYRLVVSPQLRVVGQAGGWDARGDIEIPTADITIVELSEAAVDISPDVSIVGDIYSTGAAEARVSGEANVVLGDEVHISAFGLDTNITGQLLVGKLPGRDLTGEGRVELVGGRFSAYGQNLTIEEGTLTFTGPLDDPIVFVRAVRRIEDFDGTVIAGLRLEGRASNVTATVYSEPAMSEADALSYLVMGRPLSEVSAGEGQEISTAAVGLGLRQASRITQQVGQTIGLDELTIIGDGGDATALVAGKQFNSRLYARYAYGVFSQVGMILIRYRLTERLSLEAGAGETQSIDVLYSVDQM